MDTYVDVDLNKCMRCYKCIELCTETYKSRGVLGFLIIDEYDGVPEYAWDNPICHHCSANSETPYACNKICPTGAMNITRY